MTAHIDSGSVSQVHFGLSEELAAVGEKDASLQVPRDHPFTMHTVGGQTLAVFSQSDKGQSPTQLVFCAGCCHLKYMFDGWLEGSN